MSFDAARVWHLLPDNPVTLDEFNELAKDYVRGIRGTKLIIASLLRYGWIKKNDDNTWEKVPGERPQCDVEYFYETLPTHLTWFTTGEAAEKWGLKPTGARQRLKKKLLPHKLVRERKDPRRGRFGISEWRADPVRWVKFKRRLESWPELTVSSKDAQFFG